MPDGAVLLTGASGLLGSWLLATAPQGSPVVAASATRPVDGVTSMRVDLRDGAATSAAIVDLRPSIVLHAAYAMDEASIVAATRHVVDGADRVGATVVLISTDAVFSGDGVARSEAAEPDPIWDYGRWKHQAEGTVLGGSERGVVVRLPLLVSVDPDDHVVRKLRASAGAGEVAPWFDDEVRRPAMASEVAAALWRIVDLPAAARAGVWHLAGPERLTRFGIAQRVVERLGLPASSIAPSTTPADLVRPRDLEFTDERARAAIAWDPSPILR